MVEVVGVEVAGDEVGILENTLEQRDRGGDADDLVLLERPSHPPQRDRPVGAPGDQLGDHRVIVDRHLIALVQRGIVANAGAAGHSQSLDQAGRRSEVRRRVLGVEPAFDRMAAGVDVVLGPGKGFALGDRHLCCDEIDPRDHLGNRMLDL